MRRLALVLAALLFAGCAAVPRPAAPPAVIGDPPYAAWRQVLTRFVDREGRVDFAGIARERADLDRFVAHVYDVGPNSQPQLFASREAVLAYHLNAYNALAMHQVIESGIPASLAGFAKVGFFYSRKVMVGGAPISLYDYENKVIRPLGEPRIHFALNCMSIGCPRLPREPFTAERLDAQLERETRLFLDDPRNVLVDDGAKILRLSEIFGFYTSDFLAAAPSLAAYVNRYRKRKVAEDYRVEFIPYDWTINRQP